MKEVINEIRIIQSKTEAEFKRVDDKISVLTWAIGILIALIIALKFLG